MSEGLRGLRALLAPIIPWLDDPDCSEIVINGGGSAVFVERHGVMTHQPAVTLTPDAVAHVITWIASANKQTVDAHRPLLTAKLYDGARIIARIAAVLPPCAVGGACLAIRLFPPLRSLTALLASGMLTAAEADTLLHALHRQDNILIAGATGAGKSTLAAWLISAFPPTDRIVIIEDTAEIQALNPNVVRLEALQPIQGDAVYEPGRPEVPIRALLKMAFRLRPDKLVIGEVRGAEAYDLLQSLNSGHRGSVCTIHANDAAGALTRMADCALEAGIGWSDATAHARVRDAIDLVVCVARDPDGRRRLTSIHHTRPFGTPETTHDPDPTARPIPAPPSPRPRHPDRVQ